MRFDDDNSQSFGLVLRRIAILAVIITAVPVMLWSITAFMRTFVAQPVIPSPRPLAPADTANAAPAPAAASSVSTPANAPVVEARATATDARGSDADGKNDQLSDSAAPAPTTTASLAPAPAAPAPAAPAQNAPPAPQVVDQDAASSANSPWPDPAQAIGGQQSQSAISTDDSADTLPASPPLTGPIPLPPHRPKVLALADGPIPLPRIRPADADATPDPPPDNGNFFTHLFGQTH